jgi:hypothetical protein
MQAIKSGQNQERAVLPIGGLTRQVLMNLFKNDP